MPLTDVAAVSRDDAHWRYTAEGLSTKLANAFDNALDSVDATDAEGALANLLLHGQGKFPDGSLDLSLGAGLVGNIANGYALILGRPVQVSETAGYDTVALDESATNHIYMDADGVYTVRAALYASGTQPTDEIYLGYIVTNDSGGVSVDDSDADELRSVSELQTALETLEDLSPVIQAAIGEEYFGGAPPSKSLHDRILDIIATGTGSGGATYASTLEWSSTDSRILSTVLSELIQTHLDTYHSGDDSDGTVATANQYWDMMAINQGRHVLRQTEYGDPDLPASLIGVMVIVPDVYGDGTDSTPDFIDRVNSTWLPTA